ncbi:hypothetical protein RIVM261_075410 [Rivularia sp. IAM M-261]|nr:hypothetical protein RIVM261_075410 [Rivularia sp. IAM M-261]
MRMRKIQKIMGKVQPNTLKIAAVAVAGLLTGAVAVTNDIRFEANISTISNGAEVTRTESLGVKVAFNSPYTARTLRIEKTQIRKLNSTEMRIAVSINKKYLIIATNPPAGVQGNETPQSAPEPNVQFSTCYYLLQPVKDCIG